jgi:hypothetical protein
VPTCACLRLPVPTCACLRLPVCLAALSQVPGFDHDCPFLLTAIGTYSARARTADTTYMCTYDMRMCTYDMHSEYHVYGDMQCM